MNIPRHIDFRSETVRNTQLSRALENMPWAPRPTINLRALAVSTLAVVLLAAFLLGLLAVGAA